MSPVTCLDGFANSVTRNIEVNSDRLKQVSVFVALVSLAVAVRLVSETPNFGAVTAAALFAGFYFPSRAVALLVPLCILTISDQFLGGYSKSMMVAVYGSYVVPIAFRSMLRKQLSVSRVGLSAVSSSLVFYLLTNFAVWSAWYPQTWQGLARCYTVALPFLANTLASDLVFAAGFFGLFVLVTRTSEATARVVATEAG
jgi:hypothetical protein